MTLPTQKSKLIDEMVDDWIRRYGEGETLLDIAIASGVSDTCVRDRLIKSGIALRQPSGKSNARKFTRGL